MPADILDSKAQHSNISEFLENEISRLSSEIESLNAYNTSLVGMHKSSGVANWENGAEIQEIQAQLEQSTKELLTLKRQIRY